jgi:hypothetical protein
MTRLAYSFMSAMLAVALASTGALADKIKSTGSYDGTYTKREMLPIPGQEGHALLLTESTGTAVSPGGPLDGFSTVTREIADLRQGNGPHQGYVVFSKGADELLVRFEGTVATTMKDGKPNTTMNGDYSVVGGGGTLAGMGGGGVYNGYFTAEDKYQLNWDGHMIPQKGAMASPGKN